LAITVRCDGGVKETGKNTEVSSDVFENGNGVKRRLGIVLCGFEER
jgi:hypothetical protein